MHSLLRRFRREDRGVATIEFALLGSLIITLFAGTFDVVYMVAAKRDADRASMLIARSIASCKDIACMIEFANNYRPRKGNALVRQPAAVLELYVVARLGGAFSTCFSDPSKKLTDSDLTAAALKIMYDNDIGAVAVITTTYTSILPKAVLSYVSASGTSYRQSTVDVFKHYADASTANAICAGTK